MRSKEMDVTKDSSLKLWREDEYLQRQKLHATVIFLER